MKKSHFLNLIIFLSFLTSLNSQAMEKEHIKNIFKTAIVSTSLFGIYNKLNDSSEKKGMLEMNDDELNDYINRKQLKENILYSFIISCCALTVLR